MMTLCGWTGSQCVTVGIEPAQRFRMKLGNPVMLQPMTSGGAPAPGTLVRIDGLLNPKTHLIDADVATSARLLPGAAFMAQITVGQFDGFIVPRDVVLSDAEGVYLFQTASGKARRVAVTIVGSAGDQSAVTGAIDPAKPIVLQGNYQLEDGMEVRYEREGNVGGRASRHGRTMSFVAVAERHARSILFVALALASAARCWRSAFRSGCSRRSLSPRVVVDLDAGTRPADQMALLVTGRSRRLSAPSPGVLDVRSTSDPRLRADLDRFGGDATWSQHLLVDAAISQILPNLPAGTGYDGAADGSDRLPDHLLCAAVGQPVAGRAARLGAVPNRAAALLDRRPRHGSTCRAAKRPRSRCWLIRTSSPPTALA